MEISAEYVNEFVSEAREHLDTLNNNLVELEKNPKDKEIVNAIFRSFHTIKGNSAALGFSNLSELSHQLENLLGTIRDGTLFASEDIISILLEGLDNIDLAIDSIQKNSSDELDFSQIVGKAKDALPKKDAVITGPFTLSPVEKSQIESLKGQGKNIFFADVFFKSGMLLKDVKALLVLRNISNFGTLIASNPRKDQLAAIGDKLEIIIAAESKDNITKNLNISGIDRVEASDFSEEKLSERTRLAELAKKSGVASANNDSTKNLNANAGLQSQGNQGNTDPSKKASAANQIKTNADMDISKEMQSVRISIDRLDKLMEMVGELVIYRMRLASLAEKYDSKELNEVLVNIDRLALSIQEEVIEERMVPIGQIYNKFPRMIRDLAGIESKKVNFITEGNDIKFDRTVLDEMGEPLVHILRNSVDHGIEKPDARLNTGKSETGTIRISARRERSVALIEVEDDGAGIDIDEVKNVAIRKGVIKEQDFNTITDDDARMLIFNAGMSTTREVTEISGRGVGMSIVKSKINSLGGSLKLTSEKGKGTKITMSLPLTVAIIQSLLVRVDKDTYAIPLSAVELIEELSASRIKTIQRQEVFILFEEEVPLIRLHNLFGASHDKKDNHIVVIAEHAGKRIGLLVDEVLKEQQILIKTLSDSVKRVKGFAGATILGNGEVCLILDISSLVK